MKKPIYRIFIDFKYSNITKTGKALVKNNVLDTISLETTKDGVMNDKRLMSKIYKHIKKDKNKVVIDITNIHIEGQYGETSDRF